MDATRLSGGHPRRQPGEIRQQQASFGATPYSDASSTFGINPPAADNNFISLSSAAYTTMRSVPAQHPLYSSSPSYLSQRYTTTDLSPADQYHHLARSSHSPNMGAAIDQVYLSDQSNHQYSGSDLDLSSHSTLENSEAFHSTLPTSAAAAAAAYFPLTEQWYSALEPQPHHHHQQQPFYMTPAPSSSTSSSPLPTSHPASLFPHGTPFPVSTSRLSPRPSRDHYRHTTAPSTSSITDDDTQDPSPTNQPSARDLTEYGVPNADGSWRCAYPGCTSQTTFRRGCDLRKHFNRHRKHLFCRYPECAQSTSGGFSSKKDRDRHEAKHNPDIPCEWPNCRRMFSRVDNMKDHVRRVHRRRDF